MSEPLRFFVPGKPQTAGSKSAVPTGAGVRVIEAGSKESRVRKRTWRGDLRDAAISAASRSQLAELATGPLAVTFVVVRRRPSNHVGTGRNTGVVKDWALPLLPVERPDTVKLVRAAEDALTGVIWLDDSQLVDHRLYKAFGDQVGLTWQTEGLFIAVDRCVAYRGPHIQFLINAAEVAA